MARIKGKDLYLKNDDQIYFGNNKEAAMWFDYNELMINHTVSGIDPTEPGHLTTKRYVDTYVTTVSGLVSHSLLNDLTNDDHPQYSLVDGTRAFTGTVAGIYPTEMNHLVTVEFMLDTLYGTTGSGTTISGGQIGNIIFGSEFNYTVDDSVSSTNSTSPVEKLSLNIPEIPEGNYRVAWAFDWRMSKNNVNFFFNIHLDNTTYLSNKELVPGNNVNIWNLISNFAYVTGLGAGTHNIHIDFYSAAASASAYIRNARIEFWRVS